MVAEPVFSLITGKDGGGGGVWLNWLPAQPTKTKNAGVDDFFHNVIKLFNSVKF